MCWNVFVCLFIYPSMYLSIEVSTYVYLSTHLSIYLCMYLSINLSMYVFIYLPYINIMLMPPNFIPLLLLDKAQYSDPSRLPAAIDLHSSITAFVCHLLIKRSNNCQLGLEFYKCINFSRAGAGCNCM